MNRFDLLLKMILMTLLFLVSIHLNVCSLHVSLVINELSSDQLGGDFVRKD